MSAAGVGGELGVVGLLGLLVELVELVGEIVERPGSVLVGGADGDVC